MKRLSRRNFLTDALSLAGSLPVLTAVSAKDSNANDYPSYLKLYREGTLKQREDKLFAYYENCSLCPRDCRVNRKKGETGKCRATSKVKVANAHSHFGEEAPLVGKGGSGTIFFANCGLRCLYCQNYTISIEGEGMEISDDSLAEIMVKLQKLGCHNINLVTPTHYAPNIVRAVRLAVPLGLTIPLVYNTGGYEKPEILVFWDGIVDIYLPDFKYADPAMAAKYSSEAYNYPHYARLALKEMFRQVGDLELDGRGMIARRGIILRHLILPNRIAGTEDVLKFVAENLSKTTYINLMRQYRPEYKASEFPELARQIKSGEYSEAVGWARKYGLTRLAR